MMFVIKVMSSSGTSLSVVILMILFLIKPPVRTNGISTTAIRAIYQQKLHATIIPARKVNIV
jgi:hypothetical protein